MNWHKCIMYVCMNVSYEGSTRYLFFNVHRRVFIKWTESMVTIKWHSTVSEGFIEAAIYAPRHHSFSLNQVLAGRVDECSLKNKLFGVGRTSIWYRRAISSCPRSSGYSTQYKWHRKENINQLNLNKALFLAQQTSILLKTRLGKI